MNNALAIAECRVDLVDVFLERAEARAYLWSIGDLDLHEAVDVLQTDAERDGITAHRRHWCPRSRRKRHGRNFTARRCTD